MFRASIATLRAAYERGSSQSYQQLLTDQGIENRERFLNILDNRLQSVVFFNTAAILTKIRVIPLADCFTAPLNGQTEVTVPPLPYVLPRGSESTVYLSRTVQQESCSSC